MDKKQYISPDIVRECVPDWGVPLCESTGSLSSLEESDKMQGLGWN